VPDESAQSGKFDPTQVPDRPVVVDAWVKDGVLAKVSIDVAQFFSESDKKAASTFPVVLTFDPSGDDISKPDGATTIDLTQLGSLLGGLGA